MRWKTLWHGLRCHFCFHSNIWNCKNPHSSNFQLNCQCFSAFTILFENPELTSRIPYIYLHISFTQKCNAALHSKKVTYLYSYCSCKQCCVRCAAENVQTFTPCSPKNAVSVSQHLFTIMSVKKPACQLYIKLFWQQKHKHWSILSSLPLCVILEKAFLPLILKMFILRTLCK